MSTSTQIRVAGFGGQGVMLFGQLLSYVATAKQLNTIWYPSYGPETRGGTANCSVVIAEGRINSPVFKDATHLVAFNAPSAEKFMHNLQPGGIIFFNSSIVDKNIFSSISSKSIGIPINDIANELGNPKVINMVLLGAYLEITKMFTVDDVLSALKQLWGPSKAHLIDINERALNAGIAAAKGLAK